MLIKDRIRTLRREMGVRQYVVGAAIGVRPDTISKWEIGDLVPNRAHCKSLAKFFGITEREFLFPDDGEDVELIKT